MWNIYGKKYDLTLFLDNHPGGKFILERTKGLEDITALFETYHAFSNIEQIQEVLQKYEVKEERLIEYTTDFTNYRKLIKKVKEIFPDRRSVKANINWIVNNSITITIATISFYLCYLSKINFLYKIISQIVYSICESSISFNILHDGSHYGISTNPNINLLSSRTVNNLYLWNLNAWFYHHVYYHHSFTGLGTDPDNELYVFSIPSYITNVIDKSIFCNLFYILIPGQQVGQSLLYFLLPITGEYHFSKKKFPDMIYHDWVDSLCIFMKIYLLYNAGIYQTIIHFFIINLLYYINIYPNHSSYETKIENKYIGNDWARMQISNSGNFMTDNLWWTRIFGSINYQIEHHLFPNMSNIHYPVISKVVKEYCIENNIQYVDKTTMYEAYLSFHKYLKKQI
jgi:linoleoyl-CoA desaturase